MTTQKTQFDFINDLNLKEITKAAETLAEMITLFSGLSRDNEIKAIKYMRRLSTKKY